MSISANMSSSSSDTKKKKKQKITPDELNKKIKKIQENPIDICIHACIDCPSQSSRKLRWGVCDNAYKRHSDTKLCTSDRDPYTKLLNHF